MQWKDIQYKAKSGESTFLSDSDGNIAFEIVDVVVPAVEEAYGGKGSSRQARLKSIHPPTAQAAIKNIPTETDRGAGSKAKRRMDNLTKEDYETKKKEEIMGALKKRDLKQKVKEKIAADIIKRKGDVSKSDDR